MRLLPFPLLLFLTGVSVTAADSTISHCPAYGHIKDVALFLSVFRYPDPDREADALQRDLTQEAISQLLDGGIRGHTLVREVPRFAPTLEIEITWDKPYQLPSLALIHSCVRLREPATLKRLENVDVDAVTWFYDRLELVPVEDIRETMHDHVQEALGALIREIRRTTEAEALP
jgi:hypothetical protein